MAEIWEHWDPPPHHGALPSKYNTHISAICIYEKTTNYPKFILFTAPSMKIKYLFPHIRERGKGEGNSTLPYTSLDKALNITISPVGCWLPPSGSTDTPNALYELIACVA